MRDPRSSLPEISRCEKRVAKKGTMKIIRLPQRIVAFRIDSGVTTEYPAQTDGDVRALFEQHFVGDGCSVISMTRKNASLCCEWVAVPVALSVAC